MSTQPCHAASDLPRPQPIIPHNSSCLPLPSLRVRPSCACSTLERHWHLHDWFTGVVLCIALFVEPGISSLQRFGVISLTISAGPPIPFPFLFYLKDTDPLSFISLAIWAKTCSPSQSHQGKKSLRTQLIAQSFRPNAVNLSDQLAVILSNQNPDLAITRDRNFCAYRLLDYTYFPRPLGIQPSRRRSAVASSDDGTD